MCHWHYIFGVSFLLLILKISIIAFPPKHPQSLHIDDLMLYRDILDNKGQEYYNVGTREQKETVNTLDYTIKQMDKKRGQSEKLTEEVGFGFEDGM